LGTHVRDDLLVTLCLARLQTLRTTPLAQNPRPGTVAPGVVSPISLKPPTVGPSPARRPPANKTFMRGPHTARAVLRTTLTHQGPRDPPTHPLPMAECVPKSARHGGRKGSTRSAQPSMGGQENPATRPSYARSARVDLVSGSKLALFSNHIVLRLGIQRETDRPGRRSRYSNKL
jgi:hypothetical protein